MELPVIPFRNPVFVLAAATLLATAGALAAPTAADKEFRMMDANKDGKVSAAEHAAGARKMFAAMDANKDGKVTAAEMGAAQKKITGKKPSAGDLSAADKIKVVDLDGDGLLSAAEHEAGSHAMFAKMDANGDGFLSKAELEAGHVKMLKKK